MAKYEYNKYKIIIDPESKKIQGLRVGDVVRRQYKDSQHLVYSLMVVLEIGPDLINGKESHYFVGALLEGDAPKNGELLDFVRVTSLTDKSRGGALYLTASDSDAPYMDVIDGLGFEHSLLLLTEKQRAANFIFPINGKVSNPEMLLVSYKVRASKETTASLTIGYSDEIDGADSVNITTDWQYKLTTIIADYPVQYQRELKITPDNAEWCEIENLNVVRLSDIASFAKASKARIGKITGVIDPVFGKLEGYGAYFQNLYATRNVNIAGTLTAGDENGFASTFYVGKIHKNVIVNSIECDFSNSIISTLPSPVGIGKVRQIPNDTTLIIQSSTWREQRIDKTYTFSIWIKAEQGNITLYQNEHSIVSMVINSEGWNRYRIAFKIMSSDAPQMTITLVGANPNTLVTAPQLESGENISQYQPTDTYLNETEDYGAWFSKGGIGGTIQNPLLRLNNDGSISSTDNSFVINRDGTGHFSDGRFKWTKDNIELRGVAIKWNELEQESANNLLEVIYDKADSEGWVNKLTYIDANGIFTGHLSANTVTAIQINASQITAGQIDVARLNVVALKSELITAGNINALTLDVKKGKIGGWNIGASTLFTSYIKLDATNRRIVVHRSTSGVTSGNRVQLFYNSDSDFGLYATDVNGSTTLMLGSSNLIAGWSISSTSISKNSVSLGADGSIINGTKWQLKNDGSGRLANGNIIWNTTGTVTFSSSVSLNWTTPINSITTALGGSTYPKLTKITSTGIYTGTLTATQINAVSISASSIKIGTLSADRIATGSITSTKLDANSIKANIINTTYINGLSCSFTKGTIGGWTIGSGVIYNSNLRLDNTNRRIVVYGASSGATTGQRVQLYYNSNSDFGFYATNTSGSCIARFGSSNSIAGWDITETSISKNNVYLGADGSIYSGSKWRLNNDGSGSLASGNISWNTGGAVTFSSAVSLIWKNDIESAKTTNYGYRYSKDIIINGESDKYYPVVFKGGDQYVKRKIFINRSYSEQAPPDWHNSTHKGGLTLLINTNFGNWGGVNYSWEIYELEEMYSRMFAGAVVCGNYCMFAVFLRGGGATGAKYHIYSDQPIESDFFSPAPIPHAPQIAYNSDLIFKNESYTANAPAPRTLTPAVEEEIRKRRFISLAQGNDSTLIAHPLTYIGSTGIYTGTLTANQVNAVGISADSITTGTLSANRIATGSITSAKLDATSIKANIINTGYINGLSCTFSSGKIGGWNIGSDNLTNGTIGADGSSPMQLRTVSAGSGYWYIGAYKPFGISMTWHKSANAGHIVIGQIAASGSSVKTGFVGIQMMSWDHQEYFCLSANYTRSGSKEVYNRIAGWGFDSTRIWKNSVSLGADGSITNSTKWQLNNDGSGRVANGNIIWNSSGTVTFGSSVSLSWTSPINSITNALGGSSYPKLTKITSTGIYTGTLTASQITAGTISAARIDTNSIKTSILTATNINALTLTLNKGYIGGWVINSYQISKNGVTLSSDGSIVNNTRWRLNRDGSGQLANGNISWTTAGKFTARGGVFENVRINGSMRSHFVKNDSSIWIGGDTSSQNDLKNFDNVIAVRGSWNEPINLSWTLEDSGRKICIVNYKWNSTITQGYMDISAPSGKYFYEDGIAKSRISFSREVIEMIGYGDNQTFFGWIVTNRMDIMTSSKYGNPLRHLAQGTVTASGSSASIRYLTFDGGSMSVSRVATGRYRVNLPWSLSSKYFVMLTGIWSENGPRYACTDGIYSNYFYVSVADDPARNNGGFNFIVVSNGNWGH